MDFPSQKLPLKVFATEPGDTTQATNQVSTPANREDAALASSSSLVVFEFKNDNINNSVINNKNNLTRDLQDLSVLERLELLQTFTRSFFLMKEKAKQLQQGGSRQEEAINQAFEAVTLENKRPVALLSQQLRNSYWLNETNIEQSIKISITYEQLRGQGRAEVSSAKERDLHNKLGLFMAQFFGGLEDIADRERARAEWKPPVSPIKPSKTLLAITPAQAHRIALRLNASCGKLTGDAAELFRSSPRELLSQFLYHIASWEPTQIVCRDMGRRMDVAMQVGLKMMRALRWTAPSGWVRQSLINAEQAA